MRRDTYLQPAKTVNHVAILILVLLFSTSCTWCVNDVEPELKINIVSNSESGGLHIKSSTLPFDLFEFRSCECILDGNKDFGLFEVKLGDPNSNEKHKWRINGNTLFYSWEYSEGIIVNFSAVVENDNLRLTYAISNQTPSTLKRVLLHPCLITTDAPSFFPKPDMTSLYDRVFLWSKGKRFSMGDTELGNSKIHLSLMKEEETPINWAWWINSKRTFDEPILVMSSIDNRHVLTLAFEKAIWASCNTGDERACVHLFPYFGEIKPNQKITVGGRLYLMLGTPDTAYKRVRKDFMIDK